MPGLLTHQMFGERILALLGEDTFQTEDERDAFLLGNQGPDPFFYTFYCPYGSTLRKLSRRMHRRNCVRAFDGMRTLASHMQDGARDIADAYLYGFVCHYVLDSVCHPYVYSLEYLLMNSGVPGLEDAPTQIHAQIETDLDCMMLWRDKGETIETYRPYLEVSKGSPRVLAVIDRLIRFVAAGTYQTKIPANSYRMAIRNMRRCNRFIYSPTGRKRDAIGKAERLVRPHSFAQAMSHRTTVRDTCDYDNRNHLPWTNPFTGEVSTESFLDLFEKCESLSLDAIEALLDGKPSSEIIGDVNFRGEKTYERLRRMS